MTIPFKMQLLAVAAGLPLGLSASVQAGNDYPITRYGAPLDSTQLSTHALQAAIDSCAAHGGGRVVVPRGTFQTGTVFMKDNVELHLADGARLVGSQRHEDYPIQPHTAYRSMKDVGGWAAMIMAVEKSNISITGSGTIDGRGEKLRGYLKGVPGDCNGRPRNILFISCRDVRVEGIEMRNSACWNQHYMDCEDVVVENIRVFNHANANNDGIDIDGCRRFKLSHAVIDSEDDAVVLKSTGAKPCEEVTVTNCTLSSYANGLKCGTESAGGFRNITFENCTIKPSKTKVAKMLKFSKDGITGVSLEVVDGGVMDQVTVRNVTINGTSCPLYIRLANRARKHTAEAPEPGPGQMRNITVTGLKAYGTGNFSSSITSAGTGKIENVTLRDIYVENIGGLQQGMYRSANDMGGKRHDFVGDIHPDRYWASYRDVPEDEKSYPQPTQWGNLPCYGLFARGVDGLTIEQATFVSQGNEPRPVVVAVDVDRLKVKKVAGNRNARKIIKARTGK